MSRRGHLQWHHLPNKFHKNPLIGSEVIRGTHTHTPTDTDDPVSLFHLKKKANKINLN